MIQKLTNDTDKMSNILFKIYELKKDKSTDFELISFSALNTVQTCLRQYKFNYVDKIGENKDNTYTYLGTLAHTLIEKLYRNEITKEEALSEWYSKVKNIEKLGLYFINSDKLEVSNEYLKKHRKMKNSYNKNMLRYFKNFKKTNHRHFLQEKTVLLKLSKYFKHLPYKNYVFNGKIDFIGVNEDGSLDIIDYKTSSLYSYDKMKIHSYQLILYAIALENMGYKINNVGWNFLKYANKKRIYKNNNIKYSVVERVKLTKDDEFEDCIINIEYTEENKKECLKWVFDNLYKVIKIKLMKDHDTNTFPMNYSKFFCENLCEFYKVCDIE